MSKVEEQPRTIVSTQITPDMRRALERRAAEADRTLSSEIRRGLRHYLAELTDDDPEQGGSMTLFPSMKRSGAAVGGVRSAEVQDDYPERYRAQLDARIARAREVFEEASPEDFQAIGSTGRKLLNVKTGDEFRIEESDPFAGDLRTTGVSCFFLYQGQLVFLRPKTAPRFLTEVRELARAPRGGVVVRRPDGTSTVKWGDS